MSKEQTPITAEEYLKDFSNLKFNGEVRWNNTDILIIMEQYAQAKVLEALERFIDWCDTEEKNYKSKEALIRDFLKHK